MKIWIVMRANEHGESPKLPCPYPTEEAANAHVEEAMREEWELYGAEDDDTGERMPYPDDWQAAQERVLKNFTDGSWTPFEITAHDVDFGPVVEAAGDMLAALKAIMPYAQSRIEDMNEAPDEHSAKATAAFEKAQRVIAAIESGGGPADMTTPSGIAPVDVYRVLKRYKDMDRFNWDYINRICHDIADASRTEDRADN